uniref:Endonuclease/exonuclease/phosphatase domain-containing protein n=1 Tax=Latimeria chalumnae TaxID=7897 RepID=H3B304_LATCH
FCTWNVRTLMDNPNRECPERGTAIVSRELARYNINVAALSETQLPAEGQLREEEGGYTFFWKGKPEEDRRIHGVGFAIKNRIADLLTELPIGINERLMTLRLQLSGNQWATIISTYAPTLDATDDSKEFFYANLDAVLAAVPKQDKLILLGDFNARVGRDYPLWKDTIGKEGVGKSNANGLLLLTKCTEHGLTISNTLFRQKDKYKTTWKHPRSKHWHLLDYVIVRARDRKDVHITRAMRGANDCWTDHRLVRSSMSIRLAPKYRRSSKKSRRRFTIHTLQD